VSLVATAFDANHVLDGATLAPASGDVEADQNVLCGEIFERMKVRG
jgi:hypothetical protein